MGYGGIVVWLERFELPTSWSQAVPSQRALAKPSYRQLPFPGRQALTRCGATEDLKLFSQAGYWTSGDDTSRPATCDRGRLAVAKLVMR